MRFLCFSTLVLCALFPATALAGEDARAKHPPEIACEFEGSDVVGSVTGVVLVAEERTPLEWANLVLTAKKDFQQCGVTSGPKGEFTMSNVPVGSYVLKVLYLGYRPRTEEIVVTEGEIGLTLELSPVGLSFTRAMAESLGADIEVDPGDFSLQIIPWRPPHVGEEVIFRVLIHNGSRNAVVLSRALDGSVNGARFPRITVDVDGPENAPEERGFGRLCARQRKMTNADLVEVEPGDAFDPFDGNALDLHARFRRPGRYEVTITYSTDEPDVREWMGFLDHVTKIPPEMSRTLRRLAMIEVTSSIVFWVEG